MVLPSTAATVFATSATGVYLSTDRGIVNASGVVVSSAGVKGGAFFDSNDALFVEEVSLDSGRIHNVTSGESELIIFGANDYCFTTSSGGGGYLPIMYRGSAAVLCFNPRTRFIEVQARGGAPPEFLLTPFRPDKVALGPDSGTVVTAGTTDSNGCGLAITSVDTGQVLYSTTVALATTEGALAVCSTRDVVASIFALTDSAGQYSTAVALYIFTANLSHQIHYEVLPRNSAMRLSCFGDGRVVIGDDDPNNNRAPRKAYTLTLSKD